ncbi:solute carrier family 22 member 4-like [Paramacrobiotus metropolitanus]|uniref:solute carrier family 22 member 4-like n=1 Tax=Paramacrobiotus metropolitanus TaxID=2943436 RepID=UPI00244564BA|nr:solute carrier family 22 member 4-like [Paramacrobiotus metropolitanus]
MNSDHKILTSGEETITGNIEEMTIAEPISIDPEPSEHLDLSHKAEANYNHLLRILASPGRYQMWLIFLLSLGIITTTTHDFAAIFYSTPPKATYCVIPEHQTKNGKWEVDPCQKSYSVNATLGHRDGDPVLLALMDPDYCFIVPRMENGNTSATEKGACALWACQYEVQRQWSYTREWTVVAQWDLSCDAFWLYSFSLFLYFAGALAGVFLFDMLCKRFGYKMNFLARFGITILLCIGLGFERMFWLFVLIRFLLGAVSHSIRYSCVRLILDLLPSEQRLGSIAVISAGSGFGLIVLAGVAFAVRDWRYILIATSVLSIVGMMYRWMVPQSLHWLMSHNQAMSAQQVFYKILANNRQFVPAGIDGIISGATVTMTKAQENSRSWTSLMSSSSISKPFASIVTLCFVANMVHYGILLSVPLLGGGVYINVFVSGVLDVLAIVGTMLAVRRMNIVRILFVSVFMSGLLILAGGLIPGGFDKYGTVEITRSALVLLGRVGMGTTMALLLELLFRTVPADVRSSAVGMFCGLSVAGAAVGSMFVHLGRFNYEVEFTLFGIICVCVSFLTFALPYDPPFHVADHLHAPVAQHDFGQLEDEVVFEHLPEMDPKSPYVL